MSLPGQSFLLPSLLLFAYVILTLKAARHFCGLLYMALKTRNSSVYKDLLA